MEPIFRPKLIGTVTPPPDMIAAARASLSPVAFERLMQETEGAAPTPAQLCQLVEEERARDTGV